MVSTPEGNKPQHKPVPASVKGRRTQSFPTAYEHESGPEKGEDSVRTTGKSTSGDVERPVMMEVNRATPIVSASRPKHSSVNKALVDGGKAKSGPSTKFVATRA